jgi:hypothetical protein
LVDKNIFKVCENIKSNTIFIFNGQSIGREEIYGESIYKEVIKKLDESSYNFTYIYSNLLNETHENMPNIYKQCFIMLRLTKYDGNANSVQECESMNIPVIHNQSDYGIAWKNADDIFDSICKVYNNQITT